jgi:3-deoxy-D-manno-octulosonic-acid transferase
MSNAPKTPWSRDRLAGALLAKAIAFTYNSSTPSAEGSEGPEFFHQHHPFIMGMWHGQFMLLPPLTSMGVRTRVMLAMHKDAEAMAEALRRFDLDLIRGAGAGVKGKDRGGANALRAAVLSLEEGYSVAMTAGVPAPVARRAGLGIVTLARMTGRPILPCAVASSRYVSLNTWSRLTINLPYSTLGAAVGEIIRVPADSTAEQLEVYRAKVEFEINRATRIAYEKAGGDPRRATPGAALETLIPLPPDGAPPLSARDRAVQRPRLTPGLKLMAYRALTSAARPLAGTILRKREQRGKEDPARTCERFGQASLPRPAGPLVWLHAASVGETNAILPLIDELRRRFPTHTCLLTTGTVTSARLAATRIGAGTIHQFVPLDAAAYVRRFLDHWQPDLAVFTESEIWPNLVTETSARRVPLVIANARMSKDSFRNWRRHSSIARPVFSCFSAVLAQNRTFAIRFGELGAGGVIDAGNLKIDAPPLPVDPGVTKQLQTALGERACWLAASTHDGEEAIVAKAHRAIAARVPGVLTIIAPRHPERGAAIATALRADGLVVARRSAGETVDARTDILLADTLGELGTLFAIAPIAFMGKSLGGNTANTTGGHNPIEAIQHQAAVVTGPSWHNFEDQFKVLLAANGAVEVQSADELAVAVIRLLSDRTELARQRQRASETVAKLSGALERTVNVIGELLTGSPVPVAMPVPVPVPVPGLIPVATPAVRPAVKGLGRAP